MRICPKCKNTFVPSSRHKFCSSCRKRLDKKPCPSCGALKQRKSVLCKPCFYQSKQYPTSNVKHKAIDGYIYVYFRAHPNADKNGRIYEHRLIMEQKLGRYLLPFEHVHHINGLRDDNRIENLELWTKTQPTGARVEDVVKWAREIVALYGDVSSIG